MWHSSFFYSILLHLVVFLVFFITIPDWNRLEEKPQSAPILIDLKNIKIAEKTNLPKKGGKTESKKSAQNTPAVAPPKPVEKVVPIQKETSEPKSKVIMEKKVTPKNKPVPKVPPKPVVQKRPVKPQTKPVKKTDDDDMEQLLASVEKMEKSLDKKPVVPSKKSKAEGDKNGIKGGISSDKGKEAVISQVDFISTTIRKYWNRDPGIEGVENMKIDLRVSLSSNGRVENVEILDQVRYRSDKGYQSMAESAKRAVYICDSLGQESPFVILAEKYPGEFKLWQRMVLTFSPLDN